MYADMGLGVREVNDFLKKRQRKQAVESIDLTLEYITPEEYARRTGFKLQTVWKKCREGEIKEARKIGGKWLIQAEKKVPEGIGAERENLFLELTKENAALKEKLAIIQSIVKQEDTNHESGIYPFATNL